MIRDGFVGKGWSRWVRWTLNLGLYRKQAIYAKLDAWCRMDPLLLEVDGIPNCGGSCRAP
jgi:hypothetical protein